MANPTTYMSYTKPTIGGTSQGEVLDTLLDDVDSDMNDVYDAMTAFETNASLVANGHEADSSTTPVTGVAKISNEVAAARGSQPSVNARLSVGMNPDGTLIASSYSHTQWETGGLAVNPVYVSATTYKFTGVDYRSLIQPGTPIKLSYSGATGTIYVRTKDVTYGTDTTITIWDNDPAVVNQATLGETITAYRPSNQPYFDTSVGAVQTYLSGAQMLDFIGYMKACDLITLEYYDASTLTNPFGASISVNNTGLAAVETYESGLEIGYAYNANGTVNTETYRISIGGSQTTFHTVTYGYGTQGYVKQMIRS